MTDGFVRARGGAEERHYPEAPEPLSFPIIDNHTHLEIADSALPLSPEEHLERASAVGVTRIVQVGTDLATSRWSTELASRDARVLAAVALHPNEAPRLAEAGVLEAHLDGIAALAAHPRVRAIGETGLDFFRTEPPGQAAQRASFERHIDIAKRHNLALQIHDRDAHEDVVETLERVGAPERTVFHCFSGDAALARLAADRGWYLSFSGTVTFKNAPELREALAVTPLDRIMIETDAPFLTPVPLRGRPNAPYLLPHTLRFIANELGLDERTAAEQFTANTVAVYGSWEDDVA
ncbi:MAG TPA: TatD family hydrolase [Microbacteriaceae bacterium]|nr:TatD family hydrolase [Microbacteriaceae bacterium]